MNNSIPSAGQDSSATPPTPATGPLVAPITAGLLSWGAIAIGFLGLKILMQERPEFVGPPIRSTKAELVQESPQVVARKVSDDVSVIKPVQPQFSDVQINMQGRRDYRGLRTVLDMSGEFRARYSVTNAFEEPLFVLFKCPHPRTERGDNQGLLAGELRLQSSVNGVQENVRDAWIWSGTLEPHTAASLEVSYHVGSLQGISYRVGEQNGNPVKQHRVTFTRQDLDSMRFESGDGTKRTADPTVVWERRDFLAPDFFSANIEESRNLYRSLSQLMEIGPLICLLFLLAVSAVILARQRLTAIQMLTIAAGYAFYFPLILYLSSRFTFPIALVIALVVPGALLVNYARWLLGGKLGLIGGVVFLLLYQVFPTLAAFAGWNRGMVLLCLGVVTLAVLINLQNRALKRNVAVAATMLLLFAFSGSLRAAEIQVLLPGELAGKMLAPGREITNALLAFEPAQYQVRQEATYFRVEARLSFQVLRAGELPVPLFRVPVHLQSSKFEPAEPDVARLVTVTNRPGLLVQRPGPGVLQLSYRVGLETREGKRRAQIPLLLGPSGNVRVESPRHDLELLTGSLWAKSTADKTGVYDVGVAGEELLVIEWRDQGGDPLLGRGGVAGGAKEFYGIGITRAQHLTVLNSDASCTHFAEMELPVFQTEEFHLKLPGGSRLISVSVNGSEISSPVVEDQLCRVRLPAREAQQTAHRLSFRIAYPPVRLGFVGLADFTLPEVQQTVGTLEWVVALPNGFDAQIVASGMTPQRTAPNLDRFGDYGRILKSHPHTYLTKDLAPPGPVSLSLKYRQVVRGIYEASAD
ncbi:MAG: hypothetical protein IH623_27740 [Verrucomicrobia bacterium]|nr:hypothetical protein [Verrucomicrobiota bacterium]